MDIEQLIQDLRDRGLRITSTRRHVLNVLNREPHPITALDLLDRLKARARRVNKTTVYRELERLMDEGVVRRVQFQERSARYELERHDHHHHIMCVECEDIRPIHLSAHLKKEEKDIMVETGFKHIQHSLEFFGTCANCQML